jgi:ribose-phosphate pyrophosphokinase
MNDLMLFSGNANFPLASKIASYLNIRLSDLEVSHFSDGEIYVQIKENARGKDVFVVQPTSPPANEHIMELLIIIDALKRASARRITAVIPYFGYARQDRKVQPRVPISSKLVANLLTVAGVNRVLTMDLHAGQIQGFFDIPVDHLFAAPVVVDYFKKKNLKDFVIVSPDPGGVERARAIAKRLSDASMAIIDKRRPEINQAEVLHVVGEVKGKDVIIIDDIIDTAGTVTKAAKALEDAGAHDIYVSCTHPVLSGDAIEKLENSSIKEVVVTDTIPLKDKKSGKLTVLSVAELFGEAIKRTHEETSITSLFI